MKKEKSHFRVATVGVLLPLVLLASLIEQASGQQQSLYLESFENIQNGTIPISWIETASSFNSDHTFGVTSDTGVLGSTGIKSYRQAKIGTGLGVGSTIYKRFTIPLGSSISSPGSITLKSAFLYKTLPSVGNNFFCWRLVGGPSEFRVCMEAGSNFLVTGGDTGQILVGPASQFENQWNTLEVVYNLGDTTVSVTVNNGAAQLVPIDTPFTSANSSILQVTQNFGQGQTGAIYIDDLELTFDSVDTILSCIGFEPPMDQGAITVKNNRSLPLKAQLADAGEIAVTDVDISTPPVIQVLFNSGLGGEALDVTNEALPSGQGTDGNQFVFTDEQKWQFNMKTRNYTANGTYSINMVSGNSTEYLISPTCTTTFVKE